FLLWLIIPIEITHQIPYLFWSEHKQGINNIKAPLLILANSNPVDGTVIITVQLQWVIHNQIPVPTAILLGASSQSIYIINVRGIVPVSVIIQQMVKGILCLLLLL